jgi:hypothetical protein
MLIGLLQPVTEMSDSLRRIENKVDDQKKSCKSRIRFCVRALGAKVSSRDVKYADGFIILGIAAVAGLSTDNRLPSVRSRRIWHTDNRWLKP